MHYMLITRHNTKDSSQDRTWSTFSRLQRMILMCTLISDQEVFMVATSAILWHPNDGFILWLNQKHFIRIIHHLRATEFWMLIKIMNDNNKKQRKCWKVFFGTDIVISFKLFDAERKRKKKMSSYLSKIIYTTVIRLSKIHYTLYGKMSV